MCTGSVAAQNAVMFKLRALLRGQLKSLNSEGVGEGWRLKSQRCYDRESHSREPSSVLCGFGSCQSDLAN